MDIEVVKTVEHNLSRAQVISIKSHLGARCGRIVIERRNRIGKLVCRCDCGETISLSPKRFSSGKVFECASCLKWRNTPVEQKFLGKSIYRSFLARGKCAQQRCENPNYKDYKYYGAKGKLFRFKSPKEYALYCGSLALSAGSDLQVDRIDNNGHYEIGNVRLITARENIRNRSNTFKYCGEPLADVIDKLGFAYDVYTIRKARMYFANNSRGRGRKDDPTAIEDLKLYLMNNNSPMIEDRTAA